MDNASTDGSKEFFEADLRVKYLYQNENLGFGKANNKAVEVAKGRNLLFLNSDTLLINNAVKILSDYLDSNDSVGACGGNLYTKDMQPNFSYDLHFPFIGSQINFLLHNIPSRLFGGKSLHFNCTESSKTVAYITGADLMVRKSVIDNVGGAFDPRFFMFFEETELCWRIKNKGYGVSSIPSAKVIHLAGSSIKGDETKDRMMSESRRIFLELTGKSQAYIKASNLLSSRIVRTIFLVR